MTTLLAIDPGNEKSAWCVLQDSVPVAFAKESNFIILDRMCYSSWNCALDDPESLEAAIEIMFPRGMPMSVESMQTLVWSGQFIQAFGAGRIHQVDRSAVKMHLCNSNRAKDSNIRRALIDKFGGDSVAVGGKKCGTCKGRKQCGRGKKRGPCSDCEATGWEHPPGVLHGITADVWSALAVAITYTETHQLTEATK